MTTVTDVPRDMPWLRTEAENLLQLSFDKSKANGEVGPGDAPEEFDGFTGKVELCGTRVSHEFEAFCQEAGSYRLWLVMDMENGSICLSNGGNAIGVVRMLTTTVNRA